MHVLVVDDEKHARNAVAELVREAGHDVSTAANGVEALNIIDREPIDVVVTDLNMPRMDGLELMGRLASLGIPAVVMTAYGAVDTAVGALRSGVVDYLVKPIDIDELLQAIDRSAAAPL